MRANIVQLLLLLVILAFCTFCYGMDNNRKPNDFQSFVNRDISINATGSSTAPPAAKFYNWVGTPMQMAFDGLSDTTYVKSDNGNFKSVVQILTGQPKTTSGIPATSDSLQQPESASFQPQLRPGQSTWMKGKAKATSSASFKQPKLGRSSGTNFLAGQPEATSGFPGTSASFQQPRSASFQSQQVGGSELSKQHRESTRALIRSFMSAGAHSKKNSGPSTASIMPAQNSAMLYNSTERTSMPMSQHHPTASSYQPSGTNFFMANTNNSRSFVQQQNSTGNNDLGGSGPFQSRGTTADGKRMRKKKEKRASSSNATGSQPFPTAHGQSTTALALPGDGGTSTALQPNQSTSNASDANDMVEGWWT